MGEPDGGALNAASRWELVGVTLAGTFLCGFAFGLVAVVWFYVTWALGDHRFPPATYWWVALVVTLLATIANGLWQRSVLADLDELRAEIRRLESFRG